MMCLPRTTGKLETPLIKVGREDQGLRFGSGSLEMPLRTGMEMSLSNFVRESLMVKEEHVHLGILSRVIVLKAMSHDARRKKRSEASRTNAVR